MIKITYLTFLLLFILSACAQNPDYASSAFNNELKNETNYQATTAKRVANTLDDTVNAVGNISTTVSEGLNNITIDQSDLDNSHEADGTFSEVETYNAVHGTNLNTQYDDVLLNYSEAPASKNYDNEKYRKDTEAFLREKAAREERAIRMTNAAMKYKIEHAHDNDFKTYIPERDGPVETTHHGGPTMSK